MPRVFRHLSLISRGLRARRARPDLDALAAEQDPVRFVWDILPHAARSFAASIVVLPRDASLTAAVAYLYARMLDTYEDLLVDVADRPRALRAFARRLAQRPLCRAEGIADDLARDDRDRLHVLLVDRAHLVDEVYASLSDDHRRAVSDLITAMADGMASSCERFSAQDGVLVTDAQILEYCHHVIYHPACFVIELLGGHSDRVSRDAASTSEFIQLANITRDIEKDLARGVAYDPALAPHLGAFEPDAIAAARRRLTGMALRRAHTYRRVYHDVELPGRPGTRLAAVLMLLFTDLHYRSMATRVGEVPWQGASGKLSTVLTALPAALSDRYTDWTLRRVTERMSSAASSLESPVGAAVGS